MSVHRPPRRRFAAAAFVPSLLLLVLWSSGAAPQVAEWRTKAELTAYRVSGSYDETIDYLRRLAAAHPDLVRLEPFGKTGEGRDLFVTVVSNGGVFDPQAVHRSGRAVVLVQNGIHAGEIDGKDASLALLRELIVTGSPAKLLDRVVLLVIPVLNPDGHERPSPFNRMNQNGPEDAGWRANAANLNLNRDYMKLDTPEIRSVVALFNRWLPHVIVDMHVSDGADFTYVIGHSIESTPDVHPGIAAWVDRVFRPELERRVGQTTPIARFVDFRDPADLTQGAAAYRYDPRFANGYFVLQNRPALLIETHMLKDYRTRVEGSLQTLRSVLAIADAEAPTLRRIVAQADRDTAAGIKRIPLRLELTGRTVPWTFRGYRSRRVSSEISGGTWVQWTDEPQYVEVPLATEMQPTYEVDVPAAYVVPAQFASVIEVLQAHGLEVRRTSRRWEGHVEVYHCRQPLFAGAPYEGRFPLTFGAAVVVDVPSPAVSASRAGGPRAYEPGCVPRKERVSFPAGSAVVPTRQRAAKIAVHFLEPDGPDSALSWGFFHAIFERKEYGEAYVLERVAREMLAADPALRAEFERRLAEDPAFRSDPAARLDFFYQRSRWWDARLGVYPVARLGSLDGVPLPHGQ